MPNIITHKIFAEEVLKKCQKKDIKEIIQKHLQLYYIGSNGPDFLFFYHAKPWEAYKNHSLNRIGSRLHSEGINAFYTSAIASVQKEKDLFVKEAQVAYLMGHLCHWSLDMKTHPYIFHKSGEDSSLHHRFESMMDTMMLKKYYHMDIRDFPTYEICEFDDEMLKAIARIYVPAIKDTFNEEIKVYQLREALTSWKEIQKMLHDPKAKKIKFLKAVEKVLRRPWAISGNVVPVEIDDTFDVLNEQKEAWLHPCDHQETSDASFQELFDEAIDQAVVLLDKVYGCVEYDAPSISLVNLLDDRAYDTGRKAGAEMKHFNVIYKDEKQ